MSERNNRDEGIPEQSRYLADPGAQSRTFEENRRNIDEIKEVINTRNSAIGSQDAAFKPVNDPKKALFSFKSQHFRPENQSWNQSPPSYTKPQINPNFDYRANSEALKANLSHQTEPDFSSIPKIKKKKNFNKSLDNGFRTSNQSPGLSKKPPRQSTQLENQKLIDLMMNNLTSVTGLLNQQKTQPTPKKAPQTDHSHITAPDRTPEVDLNVTGGAQNKSKSKYEDSSSERYQGFLNKFTEDLKKIEQEGTFSSDGKVYSNVKNLKDASFSSKEAIEDYIRKLSEKRIDHSNFSNSQHSSQFSTPLKRLAASAAQSNKNSFEFLAQKRDFVKNSVAEKNKIEEGLDGYEGSMKGLDDGEGRDGHYESDLEAKYSHLGRQESEVFNDPFLDNQAEKQSGSGLESFADANGSFFAKKNKKNGHKTDPVFYHILSTDKKQLPLIVEKSDSQNFDRSSRSGNSGSKGIKPQFQAKFDIYAIKSSQRESKENLDLKRLGSSQTKAQIHNRELLSRIRNAQKEKHSFIEEPEENGQNLKLEVEKSSPEAEDSIGALREGIRRRLAELQIENDLDIRGSIVEVEDAAEDVDGLHDIRIPMNNARDGLRNSQIDQNRDFEVYDDPENLDYLEYYEGAAGEMLAQNGYLDPEVVPEMGDFMQKNQKLDLKKIMEESSEQHSDASLSSPSQLNQFNRLNRAHQRIQYNEEEPNHLQDSQTSSAQENPLHFTSSQSSDLLAPPTTNQQPLQEPQDPEIFIKSDFLKNALRRSNFEFRMISMFYTWFCDGYTDKDNFSLDCLVDLMGNIWDPEIKIRVGSLVGVLKLVFYGVLEAPSASQSQLTDHLNTSFNQNSQHSENAKNPISSAQGHLKAKLITDLIDFLSNDQCTQCQYSVYVILEIFMILGKEPILLKKQSIEVLVSVLSSHPEPEVRKKCTKLLFSLDWVGLSGLISVIGRNQYSHENEELRQEILGYLINSPVAIETILVPAILNKFHSSCHIAQTKAVVALGKLGIMASTNESIPILKDLLTKSKINKNIICGTLRAFGSEGLKVFLQYLGVLEPEYGQKGVYKPGKQKIADKILSAMAYYLGCIIDPSYPGNMEIKLLGDNDDFSSKIEIKRGDVCEYVGPIEPPIFTPISSTEGDEGQGKAVEVLTTSQSTETLEEIFSENFFFTIDETDKGTLFINSEDFLVVLKRLLKIRISEKQGKVGGYGGQFGSFGVGGEASGVGDGGQDCFLSSWRSCLNKEEDFKVVCQILLKNDKEEARLRALDIRDQIQFSVRALAKLLKNKNKEVRETALHSLGRIGYNEFTHKLIPQILKRFSDKQPSVRAMAAWVIGKFGPNCLLKSSPQNLNNIHQNKILTSIQGLLKDKFWKVRTSACITLACLGPTPILLTLEHLLSCLKSGKINRQIVAETVIKMGKDGERILIEILKRMRVKDCGLIVPIIRSLELVGIWNGSGSVDFVLEELINGVKSRIDRGSTSGVRGSARRKMQSAKVEANGKIRGACLETLFKIVKRAKKGILKGHQKGLAAPQNNEDGQRESETKNTQNNDNMVEIQDGRFHCNVEMISSYLSFESLMDVFVVGLKDPLPKNRQTCHKLINLYQEEADLFYLKCATENKNSLIRSEGYCGLIQTKPYKHLRMIVFGLSDMDPSIQDVCSTFISKSFKVKRLVRYLESMVSSLLKSIESVLTFGIDGREFEDRIIQILEKIYITCESVLYSSRGPERFSGQT